MSAWSNNYGVLIALIQRGAMAGLSAMAQAVLANLIAHANAELVAWPSAATVAAETGSSVGSVYRATSELREAGLIDRCGPGRWRIVPPTQSSGQAQAKTLPQPAPESVQNQRQEIRAGANEILTGAKEIRAGARQNIYQEHKPRTAEAPPPVSRVDSPQTGSGGDCPDGLFDGPAARDLLAEHGFERRDAGRLVERYGPRRVAAAVAWADQRRRNGRIRDYRSACVTAMRDGYAPPEAPPHTEAPAKQPANIPNSIHESDESRRIEAERRAGELAVLRMTEPQKRGLLASAVADLPESSRPHILRMSLDHPMVRALLVSRAVAIEAEMLWRWRELEPPPPPPEAAPTEADHTRLEVTA